MEAKLLHFVKGMDEYVVLSSGESPADDFQRPGYVLSGEYTLTELADDGEWPGSLPTDMELTK